MKEIRISPRIVILVILKSQIYCLSLIFTIFTAGIADRAIAIAPASNPSLPLICNVRNAKDYFVGREKLLNKIHDHLFNSSNHVFFISGSVGTGKTQIIRKFIELHKNKYEIIWWFDISKNLDEQYVSFARRWNKLIKKQIQSNAEQNFFEITELDDVNKMQEEIYDRLKTTNLNWLIVFDKAENSIIPLKDLPKHNSHGYGHLIISTTNDVHLSNKIHLKELTREESIALLLKITGETDSTKADVLANTLKDYPLAVSKAGSFIVAHSAIDIQEYSRLFINKRQALWKAEHDFNLKKDDFNSYRNTLYTSISEVINKIKLKSNLAYEILKLLSFVNGKNIPESLLTKYYQIFHCKKYSKAKDLDFKNALSELKEHSLLIREYNIQDIKSKANNSKESNIDKSKNKETENNEDQEPLFAIHEIVQLVLQDLLKPEEKKRYLDGAVTTINRLLPTNIYKLNDLLNNSSYLLAHMRSLISKSEELKLYNNEVINLNLRLLEYTLLEIKSGKEAEKQINYINQLEKLTNRIEDVTRIRFTLMKSAFLELVKADYHASLEEATNANKMINNLNKGKTSYPEETLMIYNRLARLYNAIGENTQAFKYAELGKHRLEDSTDLVGYHRDYYKNLVKIYTDSGHLTQALKYSELNLSKLDELNTTINSIPICDISSHLIHADILIKLKQYKIAKQKLDLLLKLTEKSLPKNHMYRANIMVFSGYINSILDINLKQAIQDLLFAQEIYKKFFDEKSYFKNRRVFVSHRFLGEIYEKQGNYKKANEQYLTGLTILNNVYLLKSNQVPDDLSDLYYKLAVVNIKLNNIQEALEYYKIHQKVFGADHNKSIKIAEYIIDYNVDLGL